MKIFTQIVFACLLSKVMFAQPTVTVSGTLDTWTQQSIPSITATSNTAGFSIGSKGYICAGLECWEYDPGSDTWTQKADFGGVARDNAKGFSIGSKSYLGTGGSRIFWLNDFWEYNPALNIWTRIADFPGNGYRPFCFSIGNKGYAGAGGWDEDYDNSFWEYDPQNNAWSSRANVPGYSRSDAIAFSIAGKGYMGTGIEQFYDYGVLKSNFYNDLWEYNPETDSWARKADIPVDRGRSDAVGFAIGSSGYLGTGYWTDTWGEMETHYKDFWEYDPETNNWTPKADFGGGERRNAVGFSINNLGFMGMGIGGFQDWWKYTPVAVTSVPAITSFSPTSGPIGTTVTITGTNFGANPVDNIVYFGATKATITTATSISLTVTVPIGATYDPITVTTNGLTAYAAKPFNVTFEGGDGPFDDGSFIKELSLATGRSYTWSYPFGITTADFDGDGRADLAESIIYYDSLVVYRNISAVGAFAFAEKIKLPVPIDRFSSYRIPVHASDIDGDGKPDLIAVNEGNSDYYLYNGGVSFFRNKSTSGAISFEQEFFLSYQISRTQDIAIADFNGDGKADLAVLNAGGDPPYLPWYLSIQRNTSAPGNIAFANRDTIFIGEEGKHVNPISIVSRDFDGDHKPDLAWVDNRLNILSIAKNISTTDSIMFAEKTDYSLSLTPYYISSFDVDNDDKQDIVIANRTNTVSVFRNITANGNIAFSSKLDFTINAAARSLAIADLNGDGMPDIAVATDNDPNAVSLLENKSSFGVIDFALNANYDAGSAAANICIGDLDGDGKPDIAVTHQDEDSISILRNLISAENCIPPTALSVAKIRDTAALLRWTLPAEPVSGFKIRYHAVGTSQLIKRNVKGSSNHIILCGLMPNTTYQWQIRSNCLTDTSNWVRGPNFTTTSSFALSGLSMDVDSKISGNNGLKIMPNPNNGNFVIQIQLPIKEALTSLALYNSMGERIWQQAGMLSGTVIKNIVLNNKLSAGIYILKLERNDVYLMQKVVVSK
ncbi:T9SS type A sorting domain-containing protein [Panacibacter ginsenosidivorans]|uniref:T9SS type A sorting domain-containing protein n=1 Tax=Panacibacter ginsenosidivorans TaxID=1813871 RepID=A0A5B8V6R6_9BACT|nr:FG-GAP-like repeat-containing protein [Panacibacter ginsenosidivorans]QEC66909.1 T9SS type A sorting domain-containing protein [Panacibacter ginsenosidivorans]